MTSTSVASKDRLCVSGTGLELLTQGPLKGVKNTASLSILCDYYSILDIVASKVLSDHHGYQEFQKMKIRIKHVFFF